MRMLTLNILPIWVLVPLAVAWIVIRSWAQRVVLKPASNRKKESRRTFPRVLFVFAMCILLLAAMRLITRTPHLGHDGIWRAKIHDLVHKPTGGSLPRELTVVTGSGAGEH